jgi:hypothetical protein
MTKLLVFVLCLTSINIFSQPTDSKTIFKAKSDSSDLSSGEYIKTLKKAELKEKSSFGSKTLTVIPEGTILKWQSNEFGYWKVEYSNQIGFVNELRTECKSALKKFNGDLSNLKEEADLIEKNSKYVNVFKTPVYNENSKSSYTIDFLYQGDKLFIKEKTENWGYIYYDNRIWIPYRFDSKEYFDSSYSKGWILLKDVGDEKLPALTNSEKRRKQYIIDNPKINKTFKDAILKGRIALGMSEEMVVASIGYPNDINRSVGSWGVKEQWVYPYKYVYFENGTLTSWQD